MELDPGDSASLERLRMAIDDNLIWRDDATREAGDYESAVEYSGELATECLELRERLAGLEADNAEHCHDFQALAKALGILDELPDQARVLQRLGELEATLTAIRVERNEAYDAGRDGLPNPFSDDTEPLP